jgi:hypothetical protein
VAGGIDIGTDNDDELEAVFLQPQFLGQPPCRHIICQHEIPMLDDIENLDILPLNPISAGSRAVNEGQAPENAAIL